MTKEGILKRALSLPRKKRKELVKSLIKSFYSDEDTLFKEEMENKWQEENKKVIDLYNKDVDENGLILEKYRMF